jgi:hypothetical protein
LQFRELIRVRQSQKESAVTPLTPGNPVRRLGWACFALALAFWALALPLGCAGRAAVVGGFSLLAGALCGTLLALVTRTRRPTFIYACLAGAALTVWPILVGWPPGGAADVHPWRDAPSLVLNYFDALRPVMYLLGLPYPFARLGHHAPDPHPTQPE